MFYKIIIFIFCLTLSFDAYLNAENKKVPQQGYISNYGPIQNIWRFCNLASGHNRRKDILDAIKNNDKEAFKKNFLEGDLVDQSDLVIEIIVNNKLEILNIVDEEFNIDIKAVVERYEAAQPKSTQKLPHTLVAKHGPHALDMLYYLKQHGIDVDVKDEEGNTIAHTVNDRAVLDKIAGMVAINSRNNQGETPVFIATQNNDLEKLRFLKKARADVNIPNNEGLTPGHIAASGRCSAACAKIIFESPSLDPEAVNNEGVSIRKTLGTTVYKECIKGLKKINDTKSLGDHKKRCQHNKQILKYFEKGYLIRLNKKIKALKEEKSNLIELEIALSAQQIEERKKLIEEQLAQLELEKKQIEENKRTRHEELNQYEELEEVLQQELTNLENSEQTQHDDKEKK